MTKKYFWDNNPCDGHSHDLKARINFRNNKEPYITKIFNKEFFKGKYILEVGCGQGSDIYNNIKYLEKNQILIGLDYSLNSIQQAQKVKKLFSDHQIFLVNCDAENLPFKSNKITTVYSIGVLHHTPNIEKSVEEVYRVMKKNSNFVMMLYRLFSP